MGAVIVTGRQGGFTYLTLILWVAITGAALGGVAEVWSTAQRRDNEAELLHVGEQFQSALERHGATGRFPQRLEELLGDDKSLPLRRYLRRIYIDPISGRSDWGVVTLADGQIIGIHSLSDREPLKRRGFAEKYAAFADKARYSEWVFVAANAPGMALPKPADFPGQPFGAAPGAGAFPKAAGFGSLGR